MRQEQSDYSSENTILDGNLLYRLKRHRDWGGTHSVRDCEKRYRYLLQALTKASISAERIVADVRAALDPAVLPVISCRAFHETKGTFCTTKHLVVPNVACLHGGSRVLEIAIDVLRHWKLLSKRAASLHHKGLHRCDQVAQLDEREITLDVIAQKLWGKGIDPTTVEWWNRRFEEVATFRNRTRQVLLLVEPRPNLLQHMSYTRNALRLALQKPHLISTSERDEGLGELSATIEWE